MACPPRLLSGTQNRAGTAEERRTFLFIPGFSLSWIVDKENRRHQSFWAGFISFSLKVIFLKSIFDVEALSGKSIFRDFETIMTCECYTNALFLPYNEYQNYEYNIPSQKTDLISFK